MKVYIIAVSDGTGAYVLVQFFHSLQEAQDNVQVGQIILEMHLGSTGVQIIHI